MITGKIVKLIALAIVSFMVPTIMILWGLYRDYMPLIAVGLLLQIAELLLLLYIIYLLVELLKNL